MEELQVYSGLPSLSLLPLVNTNFTVVGQLNIILPRAGNLNKIAPAMFESAETDFCIMEDSVLYLLPIINVLLATDKYPKLKQNQIFTPFSIEFKENSFIISGSILEIINIQKVEGDNNAN